MTFFVGWRGYAAQLGRGERRRAAYDGEYLLFHALRHKGSGHSNRRQRHSGDVFDIIVMPKSALRFERR